MGCRLVKLNRLDFFSLERNLRVGKKGTLLIVVLLIVTVLVSVFVWVSVSVPGEGNTELPSGGSSPVPTPVGKTPENSNPLNAIGNALGQALNAATGGLVSASKPAGLVEGSKVVDSVVWRKIAANAWRYFQPGTGVDSTTGLPGASFGFPCFTDWDLGVYIQSVLDAQTIGLIGRSGEWGADYRLNKVLVFLETRELNATTGFPYWFYQAGNSSDYSVLSDYGEGVDAADTGRLFVALSNLRDYNPAWASRVNSIVSRCPYESIVGALRSQSNSSTSIYAYYAVSGFACFFPELASAPDKILSNMLNAGNVTTYGVTLPKAEISCEPLLCSLFELPANDRLAGLARQVYLAHEARFNQTGEYVAFSEGNFGVSDFIYEWVVLPDGQTWNVTKGNHESFDVKPVIYNKVAFSFLALYNSTFAKDTVVYLERALPDPFFGYYEGADYNSNVDDRSIVLQVGSNTNGLILEAARYALER